MIELTITQYQEKLENEKLIKRPTEHVYENEDYFFFFFRSREKIDYYVLIDKEDVTDLEEFRGDYCTNCFPIKSSPIFLPFKEDLEIDIDTTFKKMELLSGEDMISKSKTYAEFLEKLFNKFESKTIAAIDKINLNKYLKKNFGKFLEDLFNNVNTALFANQVKKYIRADLETGKSKAVSEVNVDVKFTDAFQQKLNQLYHEQINGYTINGKKWFGIKGVTKEIQQKVIASVQTGLNEKKTLEEIKNDVHSIYDGFTEHRSMMIARTETNRVVNEGTLLGYKESGLEGGKIFVAVHDDRSSPICDRLARKYGTKPIPLDEPFIDDETKKSFDTPPCHPHCRSRIVFRVK